MWPRLLFSPGCTGIAEYVLAGQLVHAAEPLSVLYIPAAHAEHGPPLGPVNPRLQTQFGLPVLAMGEIVFEGHGVQVLVVSPPKP
jgi:hypothetical protein